MRKRELPSGDQISFSQSRLIVRPRRTIHSTKVYRLPGGNEDNDLWTYEVDDNESQPVTCSVWVPTNEERQKIAEGQNVRLMIWSRAIPPVALDVTDEALGKRPVG